MKILICNDDGIRAPGIAALAKVFGSAGHEVTVVAPDGQRSAMSHALTMFKPMKIEETAMEGAARAWSVIGATPTDCARLGLKALCRDADFVVSGINKGWNAGYDTLYSGTVSAAMEGALVGKPSLAVSVSASHEELYPQAAEAAYRIFEYMLRFPIGKGTVMNLNYPKEAPARGFRAAPLCRSNYSDLYEPLEGEDGSTAYRLVDGIDSRPVLPGSDLDWLHRGYATLTVLRADITDDTTGNLPNLPE